MLGRPAIRWLCCLVVLFFALGQQQVVTLRDGRKITGRATKTKTGWVVETEFATLSYSTEEVVSVEEFVTPEQEYRQRLAKINPKDPEARYGLAEWAFGEELYEIARRELQEALRLKPGTGKYSLLLRQVEAKIRGLQPIKPEDRTTTTGPVKPGSEWLLGDADIYRIRLEELRSTDVAMIEFRNRVDQRFVNRMRGTGDFKQYGFADRFLAFPPVRKAIYILERIDRDNTDIKDDIIVKTGVPRFMTDFLSQVWPIVAQSCASSQCHGGGEKAKGGLRLFKVAGKNERADYTNFVILDGYVKGGIRMIDRDHVDQSLLLQFGLPAEVARFKHPIPITPVFPSADSGSYRNVARWIESLVGPQHPNYRLKYQPPFGMNLDLRALPGLTVPTTPAATRPAGED